MKLIVNLPAYNEEEKIGQTIKRIPRKFEGIDEVLVQVVNDGSKDKTAEVSRQAGAELIVSHNTNRGIGVAFKTAVTNALENGADIMVNIDADGQFNPDDIAKMINPILKGEADMVIADRFGEHKAKNIPWIKDFLNRLASKMVGKFMRYNIKDLTCGFRAMNSETMLKLNLPGGFTYTQETIIDALGKNLKLKWVPVEVTYFADRKSRVVKSVYQFVSDSFKIILKAIRDVRPMKFFGIPGLVLIIISLIILIIFLISYFQDLKISPYRNYLLLSVSLFLIGLQAIIFALIADMIKNSRKLTEDEMYLLKSYFYNKKKNETIPNPANHSSQI
ncbi:MAG: Glycosyl transferase family 2 [Candidatus Moranbacteria bacterium GW2011_GWE1_35_17]|nr:MAG: Glycosyl transferase family 2 [Candidatus Moranbacteria bacterium GW2011_GWE1_35_17]KKP84192.1 MAG: Glycosyl transferase family 2 [Candidatus Moranbacteria bacterium GW2011_GWF1_35_5]